MIKTTDGKWVIFDAETGAQLERWPVDARILIDNGTHTLEPPEGVEAVVPSAPPRHVGAPRSAAAKVFEAGDAPAKRKKGDTDNG